jgi:hypothetical protein
VLDVNQHWAVACESDFDGTSHAVAIAWVTGENLIAVKVTTHRTIKDVDERLAEIRAMNPDLHVQITPSYIDRLTSHTDGIVGQREAQIATQVMLDAFNRCTIRHDGDPALLDQFTRSTISQAQRRVGALVGCRIWWRLRGAGRNVRLGANH